LLIDYQVCFLDEQCCIDFAHVLCLRKAMNWMPTQLAARAMIELIEPDEPTVHVHVHTQPLFGLPAVYLWYRKQNG